MKLLNKHIEKAIEELSFTIASKVENEIKSNNFNKLQLAYHIKDEVIKLFQKINS